MLGLRFSCRLQMLGLRFSCPPLLGQRRTQSTTPLLRTLQLVCGTSGDGRHLAATGAPRALDARGGGVIRRTHSKPINN